MEYIFRSRKSLSALLLLSFVVASLHAQESNKNSRIIEKGFSIGIGHGIDTLNLPEGKYVPLFFIGHIGVSLTNKPKTNKGIFTLYFEPQIIPVFVKKKESTKNELEFGINIGFQHMYPLTKTVYLYTLISTGPHFISVNTVRQVRGFIFSDNFGVGFYVALKQDVCLNLGFRLRHLSNAQLKFPNQGINTFNYHIGLSKVIR